MAAFGGGKRTSKYRHVFGTPYKRDKCYDNIRISKSPHESNMCAVNGKFLAVCLEAQGGGSFVVFPLEKVRGAERKVQILGGGYHVPVCIFLTPGAHYEYGYDNIIYKADV